MIIISLRFSAPLCFALPCFALLYPALFFFLFLYSALPYGPFLPMRCFSLCSVSFNALLLLMLCFFLRSAFSDAPPFPMLRLFLCSVCFSALLLPVLCFFLCSAFSYALFFPSSASFDVLLLTMLCLFRCSVSSDALSLPMLCLFRCSVSSYALFLPMLCFFPPLSFLSLFSLFSSSLPSVFDAVFLGSLFNYQLQPIYSLKSGIDFSEPVLVTLILKCAPHGLYLPNISTAKASHE